MMRSSTGTMSCSTPYFTRNARPKKRITRPTRTMVLPPVKKRTMKFGSAGGGGGVGGLGGSGGSPSPVGGGWGEGSGGGASSFTDAASAAAASTGNSPSALGEGCAATPTAGSMPTFASIAAIRASIAASRTASDGYTACVGLVSEGCAGDGADPGSGAFIERTMIPVSQPTNPSTTAPGQPHMAAPMTTPATRNPQIIIVVLSPRVYRHSPRIVPTISCSDSRVAAAGA